MLWVFCECVWLCQVVGMGAWMWLEKTILCFHFCFASNFGTTFLCLLLISQWFAQNIVYHTRNLPLVLWPIIKVLIFIQLQFCVTYTSRLIGQKIKDTNVCTTLITKRYYEYSLQGFYHISALRLCLVCCVLFKINPELA